MTYSIELTEEEDRFLKLRASELGKSPAELIVDAVRHENQRTAAFDVRRKQLAENFRSLGTTDDELADELEEIKHQMRTERRNRAAS